MKTVKQHEFNKIKKLLQSEVPVKYIVEMVGRSRTTISLIDRCDSYSDYEAMREAHSEKIREFKRLRGANLQELDISVPEEVEPQAPPESLVRENISESLLRSLNEKVDQLGELLVEIRENL